MPAIVKAALAIGKPPALTAMSQRAIAARACSGENVTEIVTTLWG
jgi:hypothetical protein